MLLTLFSLALAAPDSAEPTEPVEPFEVALLPPKVLRWEVSAQFAGIAVEDSTWGRLTPGGTLAWGVDAGYHVLPWLTPYVAVAFNEGGMEIETDGGADFQTAFDQVHGRVGARAAWIPSPWVNLYGAAHAQVLYGSLRIDDDPDDDENPGQLTYSGLTGGGGLSVGVQAVAPTGSRNVNLLFHLEAGYVLYAPLTLEQVAVADPSGVSVRGGMGVKF